MSASYTLTGDQAHAIQRIIISIRAICPVRPPIIRREDFANEALYEKAIREGAECWYATFRASSLRFDSLASDLARAEYLGALTAIGSR